MSRKQSRSRDEVWMFIKNPAKLRRRRKDRGLSQVQLATLSGCTQQYISLLEKGIDNDCSERIAEKICKWLEVDLEDYFDERRVLPMPVVTSPSRATRRKTA